MKKMKRILVLGLATCITVLGLGISPKVTEAASKTGFRKKSVSIKVGKKKTIKFKLSKKDAKKKVTWRVIALPTEDPVSFRFKPTSSQYWAEVQVRNHRYPISKLEVLVNGSYMELTRKNYNYFAAPNGMGTGPFTFKITDIYGDVIIEKNIPLKTSAVVNGTGNFPLRK